MQTVDSPVTSRIRASGGSGCEEHDQFLEEFRDAARDLLELHEQQWLALVDDDDGSQYDALIHMANERRRSAKRSYLRHVEEHGCSNFTALIPN